MNILFMCVANSARSQLAEGIAKSLFDVNVTIQSAGSKPTHVNPFAIRALKEIGIDITAHTSKQVDDLDPVFVNTLDYVITLCAEEVCPVVISNAKKLHWPLPDPAGTGSDDEQMMRFRTTRDEIKKRLTAFVHEKSGV
jgi:arsenate reductase